MNVNDMTRQKDKHKHMTTSEYEFHEIANVYPLLMDKALSELAADIQEHGLLEDIWLHEGKILDGRNRYRACTIIRYPIPAERFRTWKGEGGDAVAFVIAKNSRRRQLTRAQQIDVYQKLKPLAEAEARKRMMAGKRSDAHPRADSARGSAYHDRRSSTQAAKGADMSRDAATKVDYLTRHAPERLDDVKVDKISLDAAYAEAHEEQGTPLARRKKVVAQSTAQEAEPTGTDVLETLLVLGDRINTLARTEGYPVITNGDVSKVAERLPAEGMVYLFGLAAETLVGLAGAAASVPLIAARKAENAKGKIQLDSLHHPDENDSVEDIGHAAWLRILRNFIQTGHPLRHETFDGTIVDHDPTLERYINLLNAKMPAATAVNHDYYRTTEGRAALDRWTSHAVLKPFFGTLAFANEHEGQGKDVVEARK